MVRYLFYTIGDLTYQSPLVHWWWDLSALLYKYGLIVAGMKVDYYGWALVLGVGWQGWNNVSYCSVTIVFVLFSLCAFLLTVFVLRVLLSSYVYLFYLCVFVVTYMYLLYYVCTAFLNLDAGLMARIQYPEGPATGHLDTGFSSFPCVYKRKLRWFPSLQFATACLSFSPPDLNFLATFF